MSGNNLTYIEITKRVDRQGNAETKSVGDLIINVSTSLHEEII